LEGPNALASFQIEEKWVVYVEVVEFKEKRKQ
jgi:hypothetical protein